MHSQPFPRSALLFAGGAIALSLVAATVGRVTGMAKEDIPVSTPVESRLLVFKDKPNGVVAVYDASNMSAPIDTVEPATNGFLRATVRGLARQRLLQGGSTTDPFRLTGWADGRLTLEDPVTHRALEMEAFGPTNEGVFAHLLTTKAGS